MRYVLDPAKLSSVGQQLLTQLRVVQAAQEVVGKGRPPELPVYPFRSIVTPKMRARMRKVRKTAKDSRRRNRG